MPHCPNCKTEVSGKSRFCHECGRRISTQEPVDNARTEEYAGVLIKCPHCGDPVEPFESVCDACGYVFQDMQCSKSMRQFSASLSRLTSSNGFIGNPDLFKERLVALIRGFTIPNNKQDIMEFFILAQANIDPRNLAWSQSSSSVKREIAEAWLAKLNQAYSKAMLSLADEEDRAYIESAYANVNEEIENAIANSRRSAIMGALKSGIGTIAALILLIIAYLVIVSAQGSYFSSTPPSQAFFLVLGADAVLLLSAFIEGKQSDRMSDLIIPIIGCFVFILLGLEEKGNGWNLFVLLGGVGGLVVLLLSFLNTALSKSKSMRSY